MSTNQLSYLTERVGRPTAEAGRIPNTDSVAGLRKDDRKSARQIAKYYRDQFERGLSIRRGRAIRWMQVLSILNGIHYFQIDAFGRWQPFAKPRDPRKIRATVPMMEPFYRWEHGRLSANQLGVTATPTTGRGSDSFYRARLAEDVMAHWLEETDVEEIDDEANQQLLVYGFHALFNEKVPWQSQTYLRTFPGCELFPVPYDARNWNEMDGIMRVLTVSNEWLEMQDELYRVRNNGQEPPRKMIDLSGSYSANMHSQFTGFSTSVQWNSKFNGATCLWVWRKPTQLNPYGEHLFMVEDEVFGYVSGLDESGRMIALQDGEIPLRPVYYIKKPHDWWGYGFCEQLVSPQLEANRQMSQIIESARFGRGFVGYNSDMIDMKDIQDGTVGLIPFKSPGPEERSQPLVAVNPIHVGHDVGAVINIVQEFARKAVGYESDILFGRQEGRTEGGPATSMLNANAQAPIQAVLDRKFRALKKVYRAILKDIKSVWPESKMIKAIGRDGVAREQLISRNAIPDADEIQLSPTPIVINGRNGMINLLFQLRQIPGDDGKTPIVTSRELRRALLMLNMAPPGLELYDKAEQRIRWRIGQIINDGQQPGLPPAEQMMESQRIEDHKLAIEMLRESILDPGYLTYGPAVQQALLRELDFHQQMLGGLVQPDNFDNDNDLYDMRQAENMLEAAELNPFTTEGTFAPGGIPV